MVTDAKVEGLAMSSRLVEATTFFVRPSFKVWGEGKKKIMKYFTS